MTPCWRLEVEGLGKVERADLEVRPLTLFVGPNNSGKSYLASLLWGLVAMQADLEPPEGPARDAADAWVLKNLLRDKVSVNVALSPEDLKLFDDLFQVTLKTYRARLATRIFNADSVRIGNLSFQNASVQRPLTFKLGEFSDQYHFEINAPEHLSVLHVVPKGFSDVDLTRLMRNLIMRHATFGRLALDLGFASDGFRDGDPIYLPASRTGFMQLYKAAARRSLRGAFRREADESDWLELTTPAFHFIDMIAFGLKAKPGERYFDEASYLEQAMTGRMELLQGSGVNEYRYHPAGASAPLPMNLSSALVTEIAPLVLVLRHLSRFPALVLEEPEAHLHPELQRRLAQVVVRLIRKGLFVWITTHSENFCQQLNNFLKLGALSPEKRAEAQLKLGYSEQDYLTLDDVAGYELKLDPTRERSSTVEMKRTEAGLVMPSFNATLIDLGKEIDYLDDLLGKTS